jgi:hypothetical protein
VEEGTRAGRDAIVAGNDAQITDRSFHLHLHGSGEDLPVIRSSEVASASGDIASAAEAVSELLKSIANHNWLINGLHRTLQKLYAEIKSLTTERDALQAQLREKVVLDTQLLHTRVSLEDATQRLVQALQSQEKLECRLAEADRQRAQAERLRAAAEEQLSHAKSRLADLERKGREPGRESGAAGSGDDTANSLTTMVDRRVVEQVLDFADRVLSEEADNLNRLSGIVQESRDAEEAIARAGELQRLREPARHIELAPVGARENASPYADPYQKSDLDAGRDLEGYDQEQGSPVTIPAVTDQDSVSHREIRRDFGYLSNIIAVLVLGSLVAAVVAFLVTGSRDSWIGLTPAQATGVQPTSDPGTSVQLDFTLQAGKASTTTFRAGGDAVRYFNVAITASALSNRCSGSAAVDYTISSDGRTIGQGRVPVDGAYFYINDLPFGRGTQLQFEADLNDAPGCRVSLGMKKPTLDKLTGWERDFGNPS